jgi:hypothetical protein
MLSLKLSSLPLVHDKSCWSEPFLPEVYQLQDQSSFSALQHPPRSCHESQVGLEEVYVFLQVDREIVWTSLTTLEPRVTSSHTAPILPLFLVTMRSIYGMDTQI